MKLTVRNLGLIERAELDIRPLTVLIGPNGTNKTWVAYALYGLMRDLPEVVPSIPGIKATLANPAEGLDEGLRRLSRELTEAVARKKRVHFSISSLTPSGSSPKAPAAAVIEGGASFLREVLRLRGEIATTARVKLQVDSQEFPPDSELVEFTVGPGIVPNFTALQIMSPLGGRGTDLHTDEFQATLKEKSWLLTWLVRHMLWPLARNVFVLPAERKTLASAHDLLRDEFTQAVSLPVAHYAEFLRTERNLLSRGLERNRPSRMEDLARMLESSIVQGTVGFRQGSKGSIFGFSPSKGPHLPIHAASSLVRAVAGLDLYLKSHATVEDFIVIDELEMNAHPEAQLALTELVAILVNRGLRVVMTTHSPYVVEHLNNLMAAARVPARRQAKLASRFRLGRREAFLPSHKVAAYSFLPEARKVKVTDVLDREEDTIDWRTFSRVTDELGDLAGYVLAAKRRT